MTAVLDQKQPERVTEWSTDRGNVVVWVGTCAGCGGKVSVGTSDDRPPKPGALCPGCRGIVGSL